MASSWFVPDWLEGAWEVCSRVLKLCWVVITSCWHVITVTVSLVVALFDSITSAIAAVVTQATVMWGILTDAFGSLDSALAAGWPAGLASGLAFANAYFPITEALIMAGALITIFTFCTVIRVIKSWLPTLGT